MAVIVNLWAVLGATVANFALGMLWYGPLFGKYWMGLMGFTQKSMKSMKMSPVKSMVFGFISTIVMATVLSTIVFYTDAAGVLGGMYVGLLVWLGFLAPKGLGAVLWENKSWNLYLLNTAYDLVSLLIMGSILAVWA